MKSLPDIRHGLMSKVKACGLKYYLNVNFFEDTHDPAEIFVTVSKNGSTLSGLIDCWCISTSSALREGVPWHKLRDKFIHQRFEPSDHENSSIIDSIAKEVDKLINHRKELWTEQKPSNAS